MSVLGRLRSRRGVIVVLVLLSLTLLTFDARGNGIIDGARRTSLDLVAPVRGAARTVARPFENVWHGVFDYEDLKRENARLESELDLQEGVSIANEAQVREYQELLAMNKLPTIAGIPSVTAQVVSRPSSNFELTVEVNQGARVGIKIGMPVVTAAGLVGRVTQVTERRSIVRLLTDPELNVAVKISGRAVPPPLLPPPGQAAPDPNATTTPPVAPPPVGGPADPALDVAPSPDVTPPPPATLLPPPTTAPGTTTTTTIPSDQLVVRDLGTLHGQGRDLALTVDYIDRNSPIEIGDPVVTSGVDESLSPADIPVGRVSSVRRTAGSFQLDVDVEPSAGLDDLTFVRVLLYAPDL